MQKAQDQRYDVLQSSSELGCAEPTISTRSPSGPSRHLLRLHKGGPVAGRIGHRRRFMSTRPAQRTGSGANSWPASSLRCGSCR